MDPALQLILDTMNQRFNELNTRFDDRDREFANHTATIESRFTELEFSHAAATATLEEHVAGLESIRVNPIVATVKQRLASLEANYVDRDTEYAQRTTDLEAVHATDVKDERHARVATLEKATADLAAWRPDMEGVLDDIRLEVQKFTNPRDC
jgi:hypothetical protein